MASFNQELKKINSKLDSCYKKLISLEEEEQECLNQVDQDLIDPIYLLSFARSKDQLNNELKYYQDCLHKLLEKKKLYLVFR